MNALVTLKNGGVLKRSFKSVAVILLLAFTSPGLWALSNCIEHSSEANRCKPNCGMMAMMSMNAGHQVSRSSAAESSCCTISNGAPVSRHAALTIGTYAQGNLQPAAMLARALPGPVRVLSPEGTMAPPAPTSCHQAILCVFLV